MTLDDREPPPIFRHSIGWSLATAAFALTLVLYGWGTAYAGGHSKLWIAGFFLSAGTLALGGVAYAGFLLSRRRDTHATLALAPLAVIVNLLSLSIAIAAAADLRW
jgi:hypothetical protein